MYLKSKIFLATASVLALGAATAAQADVTISSDVTQNMTCSGGVCAPTASNAVLNVGDLETLLAGGNVTVTTTTSGVQANNIDVTAEFDWSAASGLTLDAYQSITFTAPVTDSGTGSVSLVTNDGGSGGFLSFFGGNSLTIANLKDVLSINGVRYRLESSIKSLAYDIGRHPNGAFALANDYNAKRNGIFRSQPIPITFVGSLNGLGHSISNLEIIDSSDYSVGLVYELATPGSISSIGLKNVVVDSSAGYGANTGGIVGIQYGGTIFNSWSSGTINGGGGSATGGLVGNFYASGVITNSWSSAKVVNTNEIGVGGLVGEMSGGGAISGSFAVGHVDEYECVGGLVGDLGEGAGPITNSYARGNVDSADAMYAQTGGFIGCASGGSISSSYSTGSVAKAVAEYVGGFIGNNAVAQMSNCYWDKSTSKTDVGVGSGGARGLKGLSTKKLRSGLPQGFDPSVWAEDPSINDGFPYLIANPPQ